MRIAFSSVRAWKSRQWVRGIFAVSVCAVVLMVSAEVKLVFMQSAGIATDNDLVAELSSVAASSSESIIIADAAPDIQMLGAVKRRHNIQQMDFWPVAHHTLARPNEDVAFLTSNSIQRGGSELESFWKWMNKHAGGRFGETRVWWQSPQYSSKRGRNATL